MLEHPPHDLPKPFFTISYTCSTSYSLKWSTLLQILCPSAFRASFNSSLLRRSFSFFKAVDRSIELPPWRAAWLKKAPPRLPSRSGCRNSECRQPLWPGDSSEDLKPPSCGAFKGKARAARHDAHQLSRGEGSSRLAVRGRVVEVQQLLVGGCDGMPRGTTEGIAGCAGLQRGGRELEASLRGAVTSRGGS